MGAPLFRKKRSETFELENCACTISSSKSFVQEELYDRFQRKTRTRSLRPRIPLPAVPTRNNAPISSTLCRRRMDKDMPLRMSEYTNLLYRNIHRSGAIPDDCELIFLPIVFYNGTRKWKVPGNVRKQRKRKFPQYLAPFPYDLISESDYSAEQLQQRGRMFAAVMYLDLYSKNLLNTDWDIQKVENAIAEMLNEESLELIKEFIGVVDSMFGIVIDFDTLMNQLERTKEPRGKEVAKMFRMNAETFRARIAEMGRQEGREEGLQTGRQEGREEGIRETARSMFLEGLSTEAVQRITGLSDEEMRTLRNGSH